MVLISENKVHFYDLYNVLKVLNLSLHNQDIFFRKGDNIGKKDGLHPTALGYRFIANMCFVFKRTSTFKTKSKKYLF
ncbi:hypothetical protein ACFSKN_05125 [Mariniflexile gromovii]|uniref:GDSL-like lipase/acylhydrolase family protein n=1 Tax=Mariniflexile gromovii TaxID=362523 RepID=A0ABS4BTB1_9FLAO|nr:hypothetical protein [Mariniflexile gromovii]MBP0903829.1 hypothetical protein [Mariniflexile gromovii]